ncbi:MAG: hypothetical protein ACRDE2_03945 [Chitinophagaceae bacterium]
MENNIQIYRLPLQPDFAKQLYYHTMRKGFILFSGLIVYSILSNAQDRVFTYTYQSNVLTPQEREIEVYNTFHFGRQDFYRAYQSKIEFETGIAQNLQASFYLITNTQTGYNLKNDSAISSSSSFAIANEWKYKLSDPVANAIGSAIYTEFELSKDEFEWENKIILDKKIGRNTFALNAVGELEYGKKAVNKILENEREFKAELFFGYAYYLGKGLNAGFEARNINARSDGEWGSVNLFAGPVISYFRNNFWVNLTVMPQISSFKGATYKGLDLKNYEKLEARLAFSFEL